MKTKTIAIALVLSGWVLLGAAQVQVGGEWQLTTQSPRGERTVPLKIEQTGEKLKVTMISPRGEQKYEGTLKGTDISWSGTRQAPDGREVTFTYQGKVEGDAMKGTVAMGERGNFPWSAKRGK